MMFFTNNYQYINYPCYAAPPIQTFVPFNHDLMNCVIEPLSGKGGVYLGSLDAAINTQLLLQNNINSVLTLCSEAQITYNPPDSFNHKVISCHDIEHFDISTHFEETHQFISQARERGNILVHCVVGVSRSATVIISYLMYKWNMLLEEALRHVITQRPIINPNPGFIGQLLEYEIKLYGNVFSQLTKDLTYHYSVQDHPRYQPKPIETLSQFEIETPKKIEILKGKTEDPSTNHFNSPTLSSSSTGMKERQSEQNLAKYSGKSLKKLNEKSSLESPLRLSQAKTFTSLKKILSIGCPMDKAFQSIKIEETSMIKLDGNSSIRKSKGK